MKLSIKEVEHIAALARLKLSEEEKEKYSQQLSEILNYVEKLQAVDTSAIEPTSQVTGLENVMRQDEVIDFAAAKGLIGQMPESQDDFLKIPKVFSNK